MWIPSCDEPFNTQRLWLLCSPFKMWQPSTASPHWIVAAIAEIRSAIAEIRPAIAEIRSAIAVVEGLQDVLMLSLMSVKEFPLFSLIVRTTTHRATTFHAATGMKRQLVGHNYIGHNSIGCDRDEATTGAIQDEQVLWIVILDHGRCRPARASFHPLFMYNVQLWTVYR